MRVLYALTAGKLRASLFWETAPRGCVIGARHVETACWFPLQGLISPMKKNLLDSLTTEDKPIILSENVSHQSTNDAALCPKISKTSGMNS